MLRWTYWPCASLRDVMLDISLWHFVMDLMLRCTDSLWHFATHLMLRWTYLRMSLELCQLKLHVMTYDDVAEATKCEHMRTHFEITCLNFCKIELLLRIYEIMFLDSKK